MRNSRKVNEEFEELNRKISIVCEDNVDTFFDLAQITDEKLRTCNMIGFARNLVRDYVKDGTLADLPMFLEKLGEFAREKNGV